jgi:hypothetical protein
VDEPQFRTLMPPVAIATSPVGYVPYAATIKRGGSRRGEGPLRLPLLRGRAKEWLPKIERLAAETKKTYVHEQLLQWPGSDQRAGHAAALEAA